MAVEYKLWLEIERYSDVTDEYTEDYDPEPVAVRKSKKAAEALRQRILAVFAEEE